MRLQLLENAAGTGENMLHQSVLNDEVHSLLHPAPGKIAVDCTLGPGGHAERVLEAISPDGFLFGFDRDPCALLLAGERLARFGKRFQPLHSDFREIARLVTVPVGLILADLGVSSLQMLDPVRGFTFSSDGPLDMRMDQSHGETAAELVARSDESSLTRILQKFGEEPQARMIARAIVHAKAQGPVTSTRQLAEIVTRAVRFRGVSRTHPATRTFMALRIAVNDELNGLDRFIEESVSLLAPGGRIGIISFHSLEDRIVKNAFRALANRCTCPVDLPVCGCGREDMIRIVTPRPVTPSEQELRDNPRSRSAKLRVAERL